MFDVALLLAVRVLSGKWRAAVGRDMEAASMALEMFGPEGSAQRPFTI